MKTTMTTTTTVARCGWQGRASGDNASLLRAPAVDCAVVILIVVPLEDEYSRHCNVKYVAGKLGTNDDGGGLFSEEIVVRGVRGEKLERE